MSNLTKKSFVIGDEFINRIQFKYDLLFISYLLIGGAISHIFNFSDMFKSIMALPTIIMFPYLVGTSFSFTNKFFKPNIMNRNNLSFNFIWNWSYGIIIIVLFAYILYYFHFFNIRIYLLLILGLVSISILMKYISSNNFNFNSYNYDKLILLILILGLIFSYFMTTFSPFPYMWANDVFRHNNLVLTLIDYNELSITVPYLLTTHLVFAMMSLLYNIENTYVFFWALRFLIYPMLALGVYILSYEISKDKQVGMLAALLSIWQLDTLYQFAPKTIVTVLFPFFLYIIIKYINENDILICLKSKNKSFIVLLALISMTFLILYNHELIKEFIGFILFLFLIVSVLLIDCDFYLMVYIIFLTSSLIHISMGLVIIAFILIYFIFYIFLKLQPNFNWPRYLLLIIFLIIPILWQISNQGLSIEIYRDVPGPVVFMNINEKIGYLNTIYPYVTMISALFGTILLSKQLNTTKEAPLVLLFILSIILYLLPISGSIRFIKINTAIIAYMGARTLKFIITEGNTRNTSKIKYFKSAFIITCLIMLLVTNNINNINEQSQGGNFTQFNLGIYSAGMWVRENTDENTIIISDLMSQEIVAGLSNRKRIKELLRSRYFPTKYPQYNKVVKLLSTEDPKEAYLEINNLKSTENEFDYPTLYDTKINNSKLSPLIVIDEKRTVNWAGMSEKSFEKFSNNSYFKEVYSSNGIHMYELR